MALAALVYAFAVIVSGDALAATADQAEQATETDWTCFLGWVGLWSAALIIFYLISYGSFALLATSLLLGLIGIIGGAFLIALVLFGGFLACQRPKK